MRTERRVHSFEPICKTYIIIQMVYTNKRIQWHKYIQTISPDDSNESMWPFNIVDRGSSSSFSSSKRNILFAIITVSKRCEITSTYEHRKNVWSFIVKKRVYQSNNRVHNYKNIYLIKWNSGHVILIADHVKE